MDATEPRSGMARLVRRISLPQATSGLLILGIAVQGLDLLPASADQPAADSVPAALIAAGRPGVEQAVPREAAAAAHLFGVHGSQVPPVLPQQLAGPSLVVTGTIMIGDGSAGFAIIGDTPSNTQVYRVGAQLPGSFRLVGVYRDHVVMERDGVNVSLGFATVATVASAMLQVAGDFNAPADLTASASVDDAAALEVMNHRELVIDRVPLVETAAVPRDHDE